jgi:hypothetical protein
MSNLSDAADRRQVQLQARRDGKAVYYRERAARYRGDAAAARYRGNERASAKLDRAADADEATAARLLGY